MKHKKLLSTIVIFSFCAIGIVVLIKWPQTEEIPRERHRTRIIAPAAADGQQINSGPTDFNGYDEDSYRLLISLGEGEQVITVLNHDFNSNSIEEQLAVYRVLTDSDSLISLTLIAFDGRSYRRMWDAPVAATMPGTIFLDMQDLLGDRSNCIIITGMNSSGENTMTIFHSIPEEDPGLQFTKIAEIQMDGSITINEVQRTSAYRQGITRGQPFSITAYGRDTQSDNILDRIEITYEFNQTSGIFEQSSITRVPGTQIEQIRVREILSGQRGVFENFINDLWYHVNRDGTIDRNQYIFFDHDKREIIFYSSQTQQIYLWQQSIPTRFGLNITSRSISVSTMNRIINVELASMDSIQLRITENIRIRLDVSESWDGMYRRAGTLPRPSHAGSASQTFTEAVFDSLLGRLQFRSNGEYELSSGGTVTMGRYAFFQAAGNSLLELRPGNGAAPLTQQQSNDNRYIYLLSAAGTNTAAVNINGLDSVRLTRVRLGTGGIQELHEPPIVLTRTQDNN